MARNIIACNLSLCTGCRLCELACAATREGRFDPDYARIHCNQPQPDTPISFACVLCDDPDCVKACPRQALEKTEIGPLAVHEDACDGCGACIIACQFGGLSWVASRGKVVACDLCAGFPEPKCVAFCPTGALKYTKVVPIPKDKLLHRINVSIICDSCGICAAQCPSRAIQMVNGWLTVVDQARCHICENCNAICPLKAIRINRRIPQSAFQLPSPSSLSR